MAKKKETDIELDVDEELSKIYSPENQMQDFMKSNPKGHFNKEQSHKYIIPSGSLTLDTAMNGGIGPGIVRLVGVSEGGKSSIALSFVKNFFKVHKKSRAVLIPSEAKRLENLTENRGELKYTLEGDKWENHGCFIYRTHIYENALKIVRDLVENNPTDTRYIFVIDSVDALVPEKDFEKFTGEIGQVASGPSLASDFLKKMSLMVSVRGHILILISQVRAEINLYQAPNDAGVTDAKGGNALVHYSDWIIKVGEHETPATRIWEGAEKKSKILGHYCQILFQKTPIQKSGVKITYPIKYSNPPEVWHSYELADNLIAHNLAKSSGAWVTMDDHMIAKAKEAKLEMPAKFNGLEKFRNYFEENQEITKLFSEIIRKTLT